MLEYIPTRNILKENKSRFLIVIESNQNRLVYVDTGSGHPFPEHQMMRATVRNCLPYPGKTKRMPCCPSDAKPPFVLEFTQTQKGPNRIRVFQARQLSETR